MMMMTYAFTWNLRSCRGSDSLVVTGTTLKARSNVLWASVRVRSGSGKGCGGSSREEAAVGPQGSQEITRDKCQAFAMAVGFLIVFRLQGWCLLMDLVSARLVSDFWLQTSAVDKE